MTVKTSTWISREMGLDQLTGYAATAMRDDGFRRHAWAG
jgi:hypothetical protein